jgi:hypothetical protein
VNKLTGDAAHILHAEKERQREKMREKVIQSFHKQKENLEPMTSILNPHRGSLGRDPLQE